jgi:tyrosine-protein kinase Etk/Wzc
VARYKWTVVLATAVGTLGGVVATRFITPEYQAQATIWIESANQRGEDRGPIRSAQLLQAGAWLQLLRSYVVLEDVVRDLRLFVTPKSPGDSGLFVAFQVAGPFRAGAYRLQVDEAGRQFTLSTAEGDRVQRGAVGDSVGSMLGMRWVLPPDALQGRVVEFALAPPRAAAERLAVQLRAKTDDAGNFLSIQLTGSDPHRTAEILNAVVRRYVQVAAELKRDKLTELSKILDEQLRYSEAKLHNAERALESFRVHTITLPADRATPVTPGLEATRDPVFASFLNMKVEREQLWRDREAIARALAPAPDSSLSVDALNVIESVQRSPDLVRALKELTDRYAERRVLQYRYTADHPEIRRLTAEVHTLERQTIPALARVLTTEILVRERVLDERVRAASQDLQQIPPRAIQEGRLRREVAIAENLFTTLQQRYEEARLAEASSIPDVRVLDPAAAPLGPLSNTVPGVIFGAFLGSLGLSLVGVVLADRFDSRVRYPNQVTHEMGLRILGVLPHFDNRGAGPDEERVVQVIEAMRSVRLSLMHAYGAAGPVLVTVTSPGIGDGKSFVSTNLALACAQAGQRTLLVDGDSRRGALHRVLQSTRKPGLTDLLVGDTSLEFVSRATSYRSLHFLAAGSRFRESPELLGSPAMVELLVRLRASYDVILVDSPPLGSGVDPYTLGTLTGSMLLVLRPGSTNLDLTRTKLAVLDDLPIRVLGAVLNDVRPGGVYGYYGYLSGYGTTEERDGVALGQGTGGAFVESP